MPHFPVLQPNGKFAIYSTIVDGITLYDCTIDEALSELEAWHVLDRETERQHLEEIAAGKQPRYKHWLQWTAVLPWSIFIHGEEDMKPFIEMTPASDLETIIKMVEEIRQEQRSP